MTKQTTAPSWAKLSVRAATRCWKRRAARALREQEERKESLFRQSMETERNKKDVMERRFAEAVKRAKDDPTTGKPLREFDKAEVASGVERVHGDVRVNRQIVGFKKIRFYTNENVGAGKLSMPEQEMHTTAFWLHFPAAFLEAIRPRVAALKLLQPAAIARAE